MTEKQKWRVLAGLAPVLVASVILRMHHHPHPAAVPGRHPDDPAGAIAAEPPPVAAAPEAAPDNPASASAGEAASAASAVGLARAFLARPPAESVLPSRNLFAPGNGDSRDDFAAMRAWSPGGASASDADGALPGGGTAGGEGAGARGGAGDDDGAAGGSRDTTRARRGGGASGERERTPAGARVTPATLAPLALTATFRDGDTRMALLGGALVKEGSRVRGGYVLSRVEEDRVVLTRGGETLEINMPAK